jgi:probable rRNA maturation factor
MAGDIVISIKNLQENSKYFKVSEDEELRRLLVHGILHLAGEDHESNSPEEAMLRRQEEILARLGGESIL